MLLLLLFAQNKNNTDWHTHMHGAIESANNHDKNQLKLLCLLINLAIMHVNRTETTRAPF